MDYLSTDYEKKHSDTRSQGVRTRDSEYAGSIFTNQTVSGSSDAGDKVGECFDRNLHKKIMRRVYTAYAMRVLGGTRARHLVVMAVCAYGFVQYVSILNVAQNFSQVTVGDAGGFIFSAFEHTEIWTLAALALFVYAMHAFLRGEQANTWSLRKTF